MAARKPKAETAPAAEAPQARAGAVRPSFQQPDIAANKAISQRDNMFHRLDEGLNIIRILPRFDGAVTLANKSVLHYNFKSEDGTRNIAPGCTMFHSGRDDCYFCDLFNWLVATEDPQYDSFVNRDSKVRIEASQKLDVQAYIFDVGTKKWSGPKIVSISNTVNNSLAAMLGAAASMEMPYFSDVDRGQGIAITKYKKAPWYETQGTGKVQSLDSIDPNWAGNVILNLPDKLKVTVYNRAEQKLCAQRTYSQLPWAAIQADIG